MANLSAEDLADIETLVKDPDWRLNNLYSIMVKGNDDQTELVVPFRPNRAQRRFMAKMWHRNLILKARQLGFTTLIALMWLDHALFNPNVRCGIIAQDRESAEVIFRDKVKFAYEHLPEELIRGFPLKKDSASELLFAHNNSSIRVATSMRSGTIHRLHISEFGKICAKFPDKAKEVVTGSLPAVPQDGIAIIESTAEGQEGSFYDMTQRALGMQEQGRKLTKRDYRMHFFPWWDEPSYTMTAAETALVPISEEDEKLFSLLESTINRTLDPGQKAWYVSVLESDMGGDRVKMMQEYPGTPAEAFSVSQEGCYYAKELALVRQQGRILRIPYLDVPVNTFWDLGNGDMTAIWFHQASGMEHRFLRYHEAAGEKLGYFIKYLQDTGYIWGKHYLPHDADHERLSDTNKSIRTMLADKGLANIEVVPRVTNLDAGIQATRDVFAACYFDEQGCPDGLKRLGSYKKKWSPTLGAWMSEPAHDESSHGADAFRQFGQAAASGLMATVKPVSRGSRRYNWRAM